MWARFAGARTETLKAQSQSTASAAKRKGGLGSLAHEACVEAEQTELRGGPLRGQAGSQGEPISHALLERSDIEPPEEGEAAKQRRGGREPE